MKTTKEFLSENRGEVINFYNEKINGFYNVTLVEFMTDLMNNFKKITLGEELKKFDLFGNLEDAKKRLGLFDNTAFAPSDRDKKLAEKYKGTAYMALV